MILQEGRNCWAIRTADRVAFLVDGDAYFGALRAALKRARRRVIIIGWDVDSRVDLCPGGADDGLPPTLLAFLNAILERSPDLEIFVLGWDYSLIYAFEREPLPELRFGLRAHGRLRFALDGAHPVGGSHHQKIVVVDDAVGFVGGLDLTIRRWDTPEHRAQDGQRVDHNGVPYGPIHDAELMVDGAAARALGALARERWWLATGDHLPPETGRSDGQVWPEHVSPVLWNAPIGVSRTHPEWAGSPGVHEVETLILDAIGAARRDIYIENQYLTSNSVAHALSTRLRDPHGPAVTLVLPLEECGWLEQSSMGMLRRAVVNRLRDADRFGHLRLLHPVVPGVRGAVNLHSKVMIVDDELAWIGSANLSNRSMGLDTECVLALDAGLGSNVAPAIQRLREQLLAEHLGTAPETVHSHSGGGVHAALDVLGKGPRCLAPLPREIREAPAVNFAILEGVVCDPERPATDKLLDMMVPREMRRPIHRSLLRWAGVLMVVLGVVAVWSFTPIGEYRHLERLAGLGSTVRASAAAPLLVLGAYLTGALVLFPITAMLAATALVFPSVWGVIYGLTGTLLAALVTYGIGRGLGAQRLHWMARPRLMRFQRQLQRRGLLAVIAARMLPVGNFSVFNMIAGALHIRLRDYVLGNLLGVLPGIVLMVVLSSGLGSTMSRPRPATFVLIATVIMTMVLGIGWLRRRLRREVVQLDAADAGARSTPP